MKAFKSIFLCGRTYAKGVEIPWHKVYPMFFMHMLVFGVLGFGMAYAEKRPPVIALYVHAAFAIVVYLAFYLNAFGPDAVKWMFINSALGLMGIYSQIDWILSLFGKQAGDYPFYVHLVPFLYYVIYTFLLQIAILDLTRSRENPGRRKLVEFGYVAASLTIYTIFYCLQRQ